MSYDPLCEICAYCGNEKGDHFGPAEDPVCYRGNPFGRRFMGKGEYAPSAPVEPVGTATHTATGDYVKFDKAGF